ncbi:fibronectin type III domain-containing protein [Streptomyces sp. NPDC006632]|uniref:fibronectin type III domain-containing protein n=1 Tax=Streptomyces sp. NPDC006632 TaxID=3157182 RepID=UPI0033B3D9F8
MPKWRTRSKRYRRAVLRAHTLVVLIVSLALLAGTAGPAAAAAPARPAAQGSAQDALSGVGLARSSLVTQANGDLTVTLDTGTPYDPQVMQRQFDEEGHQGRLSDTIRQAVDEDLGGINDDDTHWVDFDGTVSMVGNTGLSLTVPAAEVRTAESWKQYFFAMAAGYLAKYLTTAGCFWALPEAALMCPVIGRFTGSLIRGLTTQYFNHELSDPKAIAKTFLNALKAAVWPTARDRLIAWLKREFPGVLSLIAGSVKAQLSSWAEAAGGWIAEVLRDMADMLPDGIAEWGPPPTTTDTPPLRVMVVGDSMTEGMEGDWTWRYRLWQWFQDQSVNVDFVGPYKGTKQPDPAGPPAPPPLQGEIQNPSATPPPVSGAYAPGVPPNFDSDHFAVWGRQAAQDKDLIGPMVAQYKPDLILFGLGFNDMGWFVSDANGTLDSMKTLVDRARAAKPDVKMAVANVPQRLFINGRQDLVDKTNQYNALLKNAIPAWSTSASPVKLVDWAGSYSCSPQSCSAGYDGLHPNATGEYQIAYAYARTLNEQFGIGRSTPSGIASFPGRPAPPVSGLTAQAVPSGIAVTWNPVFGARGYTVRYRVVGATDWTEVTVPTNRYDTTWTADGWTWEYQVRTDNKTDGTSAWSMTSATAHPQTAAAPGNIVTRATSTGVDVSWDAAKGTGTDSIDRYQIITWDRDVPGAYIGGTAVRGTSVHIDGLTPGHHYLVALATWNKAGGGMPGVARSVTIGAGTPAVPANVTIRSLDDTTVQLNWQGSPQAAGYRVWWRNINDPGQTYKTDEDFFDNPDRQVAFLFPGAWNFEFCVSAINGALESGRSSCVSVPAPPSTGGSQPPPSAGSRPSASDQAVRSPSEDGRLTERQRDLASAVPLG